jgi:hypothetical protein
MRFKIRQPKLIKVVGETTKTAHNFVVKHQLFGRVSGRRNYKLGESVLIKRVKSMNQNLFLSVILLPKKISERAEKNRETIYG